MNRISSILMLAVSAGSLIGCGGSRDHDGPPDEGDNPHNGIGVDSGSPVQLDGGTDGGFGVRDDAGIDGGDSGSIAVSCTPPTGRGTLHSTAIQADETWTAAASPHIVDYDIVIESGTLTIEPCAVVKIRNGYVITVGSNPGGAEAAIVAHGGLVDNPGGDPIRRPITFERDLPNDPWGSIRAFATGTMDFEHVDFKGGGSPDSIQNFGGTLIAIGGGGNIGLTKNLRTVDVSIEDSGGFGVNVQGRAGFTDDSTGLLIRNAGSLAPDGTVDTRYPIYVDGSGLSTIPDGTYTGNAIDEIWVANANSLPDDSITFHNRGIPYRIADGFGMAPTFAASEGGLSTLTIEAGTTIRFSPAASGNVDSMTLGRATGTLPSDVWPVRLIAAGTEGAPIVLTSGAAVPTAGDWSGVAWPGGTATGNVMSHVTIEYAGGDSGIAALGCGPIDNDAALIIWNWRPDDAFITNSIFSSSAAGGIVEGWSSDASGPDFSGNTFTNIGNGCNVTRWADGDGSCPGTRPMCL